MLGYREALRTKIQGGEPAPIKEKRLQMISEALGWPGGSRSKPNVYDVGALPDKSRVYFLKPGKEASPRKRVNPNDMTPVVKDLERRPTFRELWTSLSVASAMDFEAFRCGLVLLYRSAFLLDHHPEGSSYRFRPQPPVALCLDELEARIGSAFPFGLHGLLAYLDIIGWNEDVKYHVEEGKPTFTGRYDFGTGRVNTLLTTIRVAYQVSDFARKMAEGQGGSRAEEFGAIYGALQAFSNGRGTCLPTHGQLVDWLAPYLFKE